MTEIKPKIINGERVCRGKACPGWKDAPRLWSNHSGLCSCTWVKGIKYMDTYKGAVCIPGLRQQRDDLQKENAELKACPICDEIDTDGLEACASCYSMALTEAAKYKKENAELKMRLEKIEEWSLNCHASNLCGEMDEFRSILRGEGQ